MISTSFIPLLLLAIAQPPPEVRPIAKSGRAEIHSLEIHRSITAREGTPIDSAQLRIGLWLPSSTKTGPEPALLRLVELAPVEDNTGKLLSTPWALQFFDARFEWVRSTAHVAAENRWGPKLVLALAAPAREATKIKSLKGKALIAKPKLTALGFKDAMSFQSKQLEHPALKDFEIQATVKPDEGLPSLVKMAMKVPRRHARIFEWGLAKNGALLRDQGSLVDHLEGRMNKFYRESETADSLLAIVLQDPNEEEEFEFEFKDLELP